MLNGRPTNDIVTHKSQYYHHTLFSLFVMKIEKQKKWHNLGNKDIHTAQKA